MTGTRVYVIGIGLITPLARGVAETRSSIKEGKRGIRPITLFPVSQNAPLPVGEIHEIDDAKGVPRTHSLALMAAREAMAGSSDVPDAVIIGTTTGGMATTEEHLKRGDSSPERFKYHSTGSVAECLAAEFNCTGPIITVSTACSSGTAAIKIGVEMLRAGRAEKVLVGGAESLCRLTYYGFNSLQLIDAKGARPLDINRRGMTVSEGAAMLLLVARDKAPDNAIAEILGAGLSCDAYHPASPDPEGAGAIHAMRAALKDAGISPADIDYVNLHGTGTLDNDLSESRALTALFGDEKPYLSSVKGALGHSLGAGGAIEAVISAMSIADNVVPANIGCKTVDPELGLDPVMEPLDTEIQTVLSNSFGFGGNNASVVIGGPGRVGGTQRSYRPLCLSVVGSACITGAGTTGMTLKALAEGRSCKAMLPASKISEDIPPREARRLKRLSRMALALAIASYEDSGLAERPKSVFFGTGWGPLSETYDFLTKLYESDESFTSPTDFVGSVHNAPAGLIAIRFGATGPNITTTGGDYSFEQSLMAADLLGRDADGLMMVVGADEYHGVFSRLFDGSVPADGTAADGGGALCLRPTETSSDLRVSLLFFENSLNNPSVISSLIQGMGGPAGIDREYGSIFAGIPGACREAGGKQLDQFLSVSRFEAPVIDYRMFTGEFAAASAVATVLALNYVRTGEIPGGLCEGGSFGLNGKGILIIGLGEFITAIGVTI